MGMRGGGGIGGGADLLGEPLGRLELGRGLRRAEHGEPRIGQPVGHARGQGRLGADDDDIHRLLLAEGGDSAAVEDVERGAIGDQGDPGIARRHDQTVAFGVLQHRPGEGVLAPAAAKNEDVHGPHLLGLARRAF